MLHQQPQLQARKVMGDKAHLPRFYSHGIDIACHVRLQHVEGGIHHQGDYNVKSCRYHVRVCDQVEDACV